MTSFQSTPVSQAYNETRGCLSYAETADISDQTYGTCDSIDESTPVRKVYGPAMPYDVGRMNTSSNATPLAQNFEGFAGNALPWRIQWAPYGIPASKTNNAAISISLFCDSCSEGVIMTLMALVFPPQIGKSLWSNIPQTLNRMQQEVNARARVGMLADCPMLADGQRNWLELLVVSDVKKAFTTIQIMPSPIPTMPELHFDIQMGLRHSSDRYHDDFRPCVDGSTVCSLNYDRPSFYNPTLVEPLHGHNLPTPVQPYLQSMSTSLIKSDGLVRSWTAAVAQLEPPCPGWSISAEFAVDGKLIAECPPNADRWVRFKIHVSFFDGFNWKDKATQWAQVCPARLVAHFSGSPAQSWHSIEGAMEAVHRDVNMNAAIESLPNIEYMSDEL